jgi:hypothetical protein
MFVVQYQNFLIWLSNWKGRKADGHMYPEMARASFEFELRKLTIEKGHSQSPTNNFI